MELTAELWRIASRHLEIGPFVDRAFAAMAGRFPIEGLVVRRLRRDGRTIVTAAVAPAVTDASTRVGERQELTAVAAAAFDQWAAGGATAWIGAAPTYPPGLAAALPPALAGEHAVLSLLGERGVRGLLLVRPAQAAGRYELAPSALAELRGPFATALDNDRQLQDLAASRQSAEADRRMLLNRLGRDDITAPIVGSDGGLRGVMQRVDLVAASDAPVLILGETGAGKEVVARAIHARSLRGGGPFTRVNCGAIAPELVDSELFGHERGAFTGAHARRRGWFERSDRGTLLLDEIGELSKAAQVRLLRVLQDGCIQRVGGEESIQVDVRMIAATHADLAGMVQRGEFREDLWYRLAVFPLVLPPLRERTQDIPPLAEMLAGRAARRFGLRPQRPTSADLQALIAYPWPGNVRELGSVIDRAVILGGGQRLEIATALGFATSSGAGDRPRIARELAGRGDGTILPLDEAMVRHIRAALTATGGRIEGPSGAAALLRINPHTLRARMRKLDIDWTTYR